MPSRATERINFGKIKEIIAPPNLIELQTNSYKEFLQADQPASRRKNLGLQAVFTEVFPIESYDGKCVLDFHSYEIGEPKVDWLECLREGLTFGAPLYVTFLLKEEKGTKEEKVFMGELPLMTPQGTFVINGAERVIVSQLHRSPGLAFEATQHPNGKTLHSFRIIPDRGSWYEAQFDTSDLLYVYLDRKKRRRKFLTTTFFRALSFLDGESKGKESQDKNRGTDEEILKLFYEVEELSVKEAEKREDLPNKVLIEDAMDEEKGLVGSEFYVSTLTHDQQSKIRAMVNLDSLGLAPTAIWLNRADSRLALALKTVADSLKLPLLATNVDQVGSTDSVSFSQRKIPSITVHSVTQKTWPILHSPNDKLSAIDPDAYFSTYRVVAAYLVYLDTVFD